MYARGSCIRMGGDYFGRGYCWRLDYLSILLLTKISSYVTANNDLLRPSISCFSIIYFWSHIPSIGCCMPHVSLLRVGIISSYVEWIIGKFTPVTIHYMWLGRSMIIIWIFASYFFWFPWFFFLSNNLAVFPQAVIFWHVSIRSFKILFSLEKLESCCRPSFNCVETI